MKGPRGPFQTSITIHVQNLVVASDPRKLIKWDPEHPELCDTTLSYSLQCAQRKQVTVKIKIYSVEGWQGMELSDTFIYPDKSSDTVDLAPLFGTWQLPKGLYTFDIQVTGIAPYYDQDSLRSERVNVAYVGHQNDLTIVDSRDGIVGAHYCLCSERNDSNVYLSFYDPLLERLDEVSGATDKGVHHREALVGGLAYAGNYTIVVEAQDDHPESNKAHERRWTLPAGSNFFVQPCAHYGFANMGWFEDTDGDAWKAYNELGKVYNPITAKLQLCYSGWYPLRDKGGVLINKPKSHALYQIMPGIFGGTLLENTIWTFSGHGNVGSILFGYTPNDPNNWLTDQEVLGLPNGSLGTIKVALALSCKSAPEFISSLIQRGAKSAVGFQEPITFTGGSHWNGWFWEILTKEGKTVGDAALEATIRTWWFPDTGLISVDVQGDRGTVIY